MHLQPFQFKLCCVCLCFCAGSSLPEEGMLQFLLACFVAASQAGPVSPCVVEESMVDGGN